jgi:hypothetical protein
LLVRGTLRRRSRASPGRLLIDLAPNALPWWTHQRGEVARGNVKGAAEMLAQPFVETDEHPGAFYSETTAGNALNLEPLGRDSCVRLGRVHPGVTS